MPDPLPVVIDADSPHPPFEQVRDQISAAIESGVLRPETRLPPIRRLAGDLDLAVNTVARSYRELEAAGLVETRGRNGTFVVGTPTAARAEAARAVHDLVARLTELGLGPPEIAAMVRSELEG